MLILIAPSWEAGELSYFNFLLPYLYDQGNINLDAVQFRCKEQNTTSSVFFSLLQLFCHLDLSSFDCMFLREKVFVQPFL